jgi:hypothetical protein
MDETGAREHKSERLLWLSIKVAHLSSDITNSSVVYTTQDCAIELSQQARHGASARLTGIFA